MAIDRALLGRKLKDYRLQLQLDLLEVSAATGIFDQFHFMRQLGLMPGSAK